MRDKQGSPKTLKRVGKTKTRIPYETSNFNQGLESQDEIRNRNLTTNREGKPSHIRVFAAKIQILFELWKKSSKKLEKKAEHDLVQDAHARTSLSPTPSTHLRKSMISSNASKAQSPSSSASAYSKPLTYHERLFCDYHSYHETYPTRPPSVPPLVPLPTLKTPSESVKTPCRRAL